MAVEDSCRGASRMYVSCRFFFFFKAEDGIRDVAVTGVSDVCSSDLPPGASLVRSSPATFFITRPPLCTRRPSPVTKVTPSRWSRDRKSTRLNSSHGYISYAVFCLKKKKNNKTNNDAQTNKTQHITDPNPPRALTPTS